MVKKTYSSIQLIMLTILLFLCYSAWSGYQMTSTFTPQIEAATEIKLSATNAHLWLEEILVGDKYENIDDVWMKLDETLWYINALLEGDVNQEGTIKPLTNPKLIREIRIVKKKFMGWRSIAEDRYLNADPTTATGTELDQQFDTLFNDFVDETDKVETMLQDEINQTLQEFIIIQLIIITGAISLFVVILRLLVKKDDENTEQFEAIKNQEERLRITLDSIGDAVITTNHQQKIVRLNPIAEKITGWTNKDAIGLELSSILQLINGVTRNKVDNPAEKVLETGKVQELTSDTILIARDGVEYHIADSAAPIYSFQKKIIGIVIVFRDVTGQLEMQEKLSQRSKMDAIGELAGGVAHDFNNMLAAIQGAAELLNFPDRKLDDKSQKYVQMIFDASDRAAGLTRKLLAFARKGSIVSSTIDLHQIIEDTISIFQQTIDKNIKITLDPSAEHSLVVGDDSALQNALMNLGINASHAMENGGELSVTTRNIHLQQYYCETSSFNIEPGEYVEIEFSDSGSGIEHRVLQRIFEPFFTTKSQGKGTGLGLSAVYGTIQEHHGAINVYSEVGVGTSFHIYLPCSESKAISSKKYGNIIKGHGEVILLVDDEEIIRVTCKLMLEEMGYKVIVAENGLVAIEIFKQRHHYIDLVIMDMVMPKMNGMDAFFKMKEIQSNCRVIVASGFSKEDSIRKMSKAGLLDYLRKPYREHELSQKVSEALKTEL